MQEKKVKWTKQQERAISARGSDVLVTASAGTGKTAVLSGRCADIVSDKDICPDVRSLLVLTFTEMAAEEMRARIDEELRKAFLETKEARLGRQLVLLAGADIGTIHSFCRRIIVEHFYELGLDPSFVVIDSDEQRLLKAESLEKTIEWAWGQEYLKQGMRELLYRRDVRGSDGFLGRIIELSDFLEGIVSPEKWYERALVLAEAINPFDTEIGRKQKELVAGKLERILNQLMGCRRLYEKEGGEGDWSKKFEESHIAPVRRCIENLKAGSWENCAESIRSFSKPTTYKPRGFDETKAGLRFRSYQSWR
jgi:ATP-dependent helicase/nuclease subunit A